MFRGIKSRHALTEIARHQGEDVSPHRRTGTTTGLALRYIGSALIEPGLEIDIRDHTGSEEDNQKLMLVMYDIIDTLDLKGFILNQIRQTVVYHLDW